MRFTLSLLPLLAICACIGEASHKTADRKTDQRRSAKPAAASPPPAMLAQINQAAPGASAAKPSAPATLDAAVAPPDPFIIRAEVLLARARFSPGVVDGQFGSNFKHAVAAFQTAHDLPANGSIDDRTWQALAAAGGPPAARAYSITAADVAGPFAADVGEDFVKLAAFAAGAAIHRSRRSPGRAISHEPGLAQGTQSRRQFRGCRRADHRC